MISLCIKDSWFFLALSDRNDFYITPGLCGPRVPTTYFVAMYPTASGKYLWSKFVWLATFQKGDIILCFVTSSNSDPVSSLGGSGFFLSWLFLFELIFTAGRTSRSPVVCQLLIFLWELIKSVCMSPTFSGLGVKLWAGGRAVPESMVWTQTESHLRPCFMAGTLSSAFPPLHDPTL